MTSTNLQELLADPGRMNRDTLYELRNLLVRYPFFQTARLLYLKNLYLLHDPCFGEELRKAALYVTDRRILFFLIEGNKFVIEARPRQPEEILPEEPTLDRTLSLINSFLSSLPEEIAQPVSLDSSDYTSYLLREDDLLPEETEKDEVPRMKGQDLIDGFIEKTKEENAIRLDLSSGNEAEEPVETEVVLDENGEDESCFTETLAKIYIKQQRYSKALEIIKKLSLKYPKKNAYFADQIRFLEKLIINTKSK